MLNSLHCLLLFWEAQESKQSTRPGKKKSLDKSYQYKFNGWKSCFLKERKRQLKINYILLYVSYMSLRNNQFYETDQVK